MVKLIKIKKKANFYEIFVGLSGNCISFYSYNNNKSHIYNILATIASINLFKDIKELKKDTFLNFKTPIGRGDISKISFKNKKFFLVDLQEIELNVRN